MSKESVEIVRSMYQQGNPSRFFDLLDDEVEVDTSAVGPGALPRLADVAQTGSFLALLMHFLRFLLPLGCFFVHFLIAAARGVIST
jgi:hypothetical protein